MTRLSIVFAALLLLAAPSAAAADVMLEPAGQYSFGEVALGAAVGTDVAVANTGPDPVTIGPASVAGSPSMSITLDDCAGLVLEAYEYCEVTVAFAPALPGPLQAQLTVPSDAPTAPHVLVLTGIGQKASQPPPPGPAFTWFPTALDFGQVTVGGGAVPGLPVPPAPGLAFQSVTIGRPSTLAVAARLEGPDAAAFNLRDRCIGKATQCHVSVWFRPTRIGPHQAALVLEGGGQTGTIPLTGIGIGTGYKAPTTPPDTTVGDARKALAKALAARIAGWRDLGRKKIRRAKAFAIASPAVKGLSGTLALEVRAAGKRPRLIASGTLAYPAKRGRQLKATLTRAGKRLLAEKGRRDLRVMLRLEPSDRADVEVVRRFTLPG